MSNFMIALLVGVGSSVWIYSKMMRNTGGITKSSIMVAAIGGVLIFALILTIAIIFT